MKVETLMKNLCITREQAEELIKADKEVDRMSKISDINSDLTKEQIQESKKARAAERKRTVYKFDTKREKKVNEPKKEIIAAFVESLGDLEALEVTNDEREFSFVKNGVEYKVILSTPRNRKLIS